MTSELKTNPRWIIAIRPGKREPSRKITAIEDLGKGGFSMLLPCHKSRSGYLFKQPLVPGLPMPHAVRWQGAVKFGPADEARFRYHPDGFVEFCGRRAERIKASRDVISGDTQGLGLFSVPLAKHIGVPVIATTVYGMNQFDLANEANQQIVFGPEDFRYQRCLPDTANSWLLAIFLFTQNLLPPVRVNGKRYSVMIGLSSPNSGVASVQELRLIRLPQLNMFLGAYVSRVNRQIQSESGWLFVGPGSYTGDRRGQVLMGIYPQTDIPQAI
jgi:hypothetical protein